MTRCVIDSDGLFIEEQYFDDCRQSIEAEVPVLEQHQAAKWVGEGWEIVPAYRGCMVVIGGDVQVWNELGNLPVDAVLICAD